MRPSATSRPFSSGRAVPLAVRSSSLLEDSRHQPFTGVYATLVVANDSGSTAERMVRLSAAIRRVYASVFTRAAKAYLTATTYRLEEEKMAVILQRIAGTGSRCREQRPLLSDDLGRRRARTTSTRSGR